MPANTARITVRSMTSPYTRYGLVCTYSLVVKLRVVQLRELIREGFDKKPVRHSA
jgi:hypothetical protein